MRLGNVFSLVRVGDQPVTPIGVTSSVTVAKLFQRAFEEALELVCGTLDRLVHRSCMVRDGGRLTSLEPRFHHAPLVLAARLGAVLVANVDLDARHVRAHVAQGLLDNVRDVIGETFARFNIRVGL
jgi:hypothetical protein